MPIYNIAFYGALSFLAGILATGFDLTAVWAVLFFGAAVFIFSFIVKCEWNTALFFISIFAFGIFYYGFFFNFKESGHKITFDKNIVFSGVVSREPKLSEKFQKITIELDAPFTGEISVIAPVSPELNYGDIVEATGEIKEPSSKNQEPVSFFPKLKITAEHRGFWLKENLLNFKKSIILQFKKFLPSDSAALLSGLTLGWRGDFTDKFKKEMSLSGTTHLVALSGYNITILVIVVAAVFGYWLSRRLTFWLTGATICLFILMVGAEASVVRASIMGFLALLAKEAGKRYNPRNAIVLTAAAMVLADPGIFFDVGFELSFLSLIGIVYLAPAINKLFGMEENSKSFMSWRENAVTTLSAQLAVAPILISVFGNFSLTSIAANILILELVPITMLLGFILAAFGWLFYYSAFIISFLENILLRYELGVIKFFSDWSMPVFTSFNSWLFFAIYYFGLIAFVILQKKVPMPAANIKEKL
ncbi:MAG: ComEC/Rec2 family competence protein [Patescibacteria group bacterium]